MRYGRARIRTLSRWNDCSGLVRARRRCCFNATRQQSSPSAALRPGLGDHIAPRDSFVNGRPISSVLLVLPLRRERESAHRLLARLTGRHSRDAPAVEGGEGAAFAGEIWAGEPVPPRCGALLHAGRGKLDTDGLSRCARHALPLKGPYSLEGSASRPTDVFAPLTRSVIRSAATAPVDVTQRVPPESKLRTGGLDLQELPRQGSAFGGCREARARAISRSIIIIVMYKSPGNSTMLNADYVKQHGPT